MTAAITALAAATTTSINAVRQEMNERFIQMDQKLYHLEQKLDRKTDRVFWWTISLLTALCMALYFKH